MARIPGRSQAAFPLTVVATFALAFLPGPWMSWKGWSNSVANVARWPMLPIGNTGGWFANWLRPGVTFNVPKDESAALEMAKALDFQQQETERYKRLFLEQRMRVDALEQQVAELQQIPLSVRTIAGAPIAADTPITSRGGDANNGLVELKMPDEARDRVTENTTIAVYGAVNLLGRVTEASKFRVMMMPITNKATTLIKAVIIPADRIDDSTYPISSAATILLSPTGEGTLKGDASRAKDIGKGDKVILNDPNWPEWAQAMVLGMVEMVRPLESEPLEQEVIVRPRVLISELSRVTLLTGSADSRGGSR